MNETIQYIFGSLKYSEKSIKVIKRALRHQAKFNLTVAFFTSMATVYIALTEIRLNEQNKRIAEINKKLEELNHVEGE